MKWRQIIRLDRTQPSTGEYNNWKEQIAQECFRQCVYCAIGEQPWGGIDHYHIDHFRPKSLFIALKNVITNLYYACPVCNRFKSDDWPNDCQDLNEICYPDPSDWNYVDLFNVDETTFFLSGKNKAAQYIIERLYLNRPQLIYERREVFLNQRFSNALNDAYKLSQVDSDPVFLKELVQLNITVSEHLLKRADIRPYRLLEIQKLKKGAQEID